MESNQTKEFVGKESVLGNNPLALNLFIDLYGQDVNSLEEIGDVDLNLRDLVQRKEYVKGPKQGKVSTILSSEAKQFSKIFFAKTIVQKCGNTHSIADFQEAFSQIARYYAPRNPDESRAFERLSQRLLTIARFQAYRYQDAVRAEHVSHRGILQISETSEKPAPSPDMQINQSRKRWLRLACRVAMYGLTFLTWAQKDPTAEYIDPMARQHLINTGQQANVLPQGDMLDSSRVSLVSPYGETQSQDHDAIFINPPSLPDNIELSDGARDFPPIDSATQSQIQPVIKEAIAELPEPPSQPETPTALREEISHIISEASSSTQLPKNGSTISTSAALSQDGIASNEQTIQPNTVVESMPNASTHEPILIPEGSIFSPEFPQLENMQLNVLERNVNSMFESVSEKPDNMFIALYEERVGVILTMGDENTYVVTMQFPIGVSNDFNHIEYIFGVPDSRGVMRNPSDRNLGNFLRG